MQNSEASLAPIPEPQNKESQTETVRHVPDKNRVDTIARRSEPGRQGEASVYIPPSQLHPERSTAQSAFDNPLRASSGGSYGLDHFMDKGSVAEHAAGRPVEVPHTASQTKGRTSQINRSIHQHPYLYALGALGLGIILGRFVAFARS